MPRTLVARRQLLLGLGVTTLTAQWPRVARGQQSPIRIAAVPFETTAEPFYARDQGFFAKAGVDVTFDGFSSNGAAIIAAVLGGSMDIGVSNIVSLASAHARGIPLTIVVGAGVQSAQQPTDALLVPMGSSIRTGKDLDGKTIACGGLNTIAQYGCQAWIDKTGGQSTRSKFVEMTSPAIIAALSESRIDAAMLTEPFIAEGKKTARIIGYPMVEAGKNSGNPRRRFPDPVGDDPCVKPNAVPRDGGCCATAAGDRRCCEIWEHEILCSTGAHISGVRNPGDGFLRVREGFPSRPCDAPPRSSARRTER
jgi:hypothetical protein